MSSVGQVVGGAVGLFFGGPMGAQIGIMLGGLLDPPKLPTINGPRVSDLSVQTATYAATIPRVYGTVAVKGNVFWVEGDRIRESVKKTKSGGKGGPSQTTKTYSYSATFAVGLCKGPIAGVRRIWVGAKLIYDAGSEDLEAIIASNQAASGFKIYLGDETQLPNPRMQADKGVSNTPGYRGLAYIVFYDLGLAEYGNSLMGAQVKVEVVKVGSPPIVCPAFYSLAATLPGNFGGSGTRAQLSVDLKEGVLITGEIQGSSLAIQKRTIYGQLITIDRVIGGELLTTNAGSFTYNPWLPALNNPYSYYATRGSRNTVVYNNGVPCLVEGKSYGVALCDLDKVTYAAHGGAIRGFSSGVIIAEHRVSSGNTEYHCGLCTDGEFLYALFNNNPSVNPAIPYNGNVLVEFDKQLNVVAFWGGITLTALSQGGVPPTALRRRVLFGTVSEVTGVSVFTLNDNGTVTTSCGVANNNHVVKPVGSIVTYGKTLYYIESAPIESNQIPLSSIIQSETLQSKLITPSDVNTATLTDQVRGYRISQQGAIRGAIEPLQTAYPFDVVQRGYQLHYVRRPKAPVAVVDQIIGEFRVDREMDAELPREVTVEYLDVDREYE